MNEFTDKELKEIIKATLFVSGDGIQLNEFADKFGRDLEEIKTLVEQLKEEMSGEQGIHLITYSNKAQLSSNPKYAEAIASVLNPIREKALTKAAMQTLAIIAYKQPITRLEIENIRGVSADYAVQVLLENNMIEVVGRKDVVGKPLLFGTTEEFLKRFDLQDLQNLPDYDELLEKIKLIRNENEKPQSDSLYKDYEISDELPDYLKGEEYVKLSSEELKQKKEQDMALAQKLKNIDSVIRHNKVTEETAETKPEVESNMSDEEIEGMFAKILNKEEEKPQEETDLA